MKEILGILLIGLNLSAWANDFKIFTTPQLVKAGEPFDITLFLKKKLRNVSSVALELTPLSGVEQGAVSVVKGEFLKGDRLESSKLYRFKKVIIPKEGWWKLNIMVIREDAYHELSDPFIYEAIRAIKVQPGPEEE